MKVIVDLDLCQGHGQCELAAPDVFEIGDDALARLRTDDPPRALLPQVEDAILRCPADAIRVTGE